MMLATTILPAPPATPYVLGTHFKSVRAIESLVAQLFQSGQYPRGGVALARVVESLVAQLFQSGQYPRGGVALASQRVFQSTILNLHTEGLSSHQGKGYSTKVWNSVIRGLEISCGMNFKSKLQACTWTFLLRHNWPIHLLEEMKIQIGSMQCVLEFATAICPARRKAGLPLLFVIGRSLPFSSKKVESEYGLATNEKIEIHGVRDEDDDAEIDTEQNLLLLPELVFGDNIVDASLLVLDFAILMITRDLLI
ncbi:hypothetical protein L6452_08409 [Arctium lappa]|uniref:Uncharacterized protein n=1 Tax=Arctium lappa TaxID=4217 RepID=A0ACB9DH77_ARCLA|nr:hypothetical protein L6452_08409 [Arctium lappa]